MKKIFGFDQVTEFTSEANPGTINDKWLQSAVSCGINRLSIGMQAYQDDLLKGKELYLLRNESRKGIGFFESSNFYPDFILWLMDGDHQHVVFIDPKGIRNLKKQLENEKINLFNELKEKNTAFSIAVDTNDNKTIENLQLKIQDIS